MPVSIQLGDGLGAVAGIRGPGDSHRTLTTHQSLRQTGSGYGIVR